jgi:hypothetical protein
MTLEIGAIITSTSISTTTIMVVYTTTSEFRNIQQFIKIFAHGSQAQKEAIFSSPLLWKRSL